MTTRPLVGYFDRFADAPEEAQHLRRFILNLATRGKLVPQDREDEPASALLTRIEAERMRVATETHRTSRNDRLRPIDESDQPFELPASWEWLRFGALAQFRAGATPPRHESRYWDATDFAWVSIADMIDGGIIQGTKEKVSELARQNVFRTDPVPAGTLLMSFKLTIGKVSWLGIPAFHNEAIVAIHAYVGGVEPYLFKVLPLFAQRGDTKNAIKGATLNRESIANIALPFPPLAEQQRILAKVEELMALCDELEVAQAATLRRRQALLNAVLHEALATPNPD